MDFLEIGPVACDGIIVGDELVALDEAAGEEAGTNDVGEECVAYGKGEEETWTSINSGKMKDDGDLKTKKI